MINRNYTHQGLDLDCKATQGQGKDITLILWRRKELDLRIGVSVCWSVSHPLPPPNSLCSTPALWLYPFPSSLYLIQGILVTDILQRISTSTYSTVCYSLGVYFHFNLFAVILGLEDNLSIF